MLQNLKSKSKCGKEISIYIIFPQNLASFSQKKGNTRKKNSPFIFEFWQNFAPKIRLLIIMVGKFFLGGHFFFGTFFFQVCSMGMNPVPYSCKAHDLGLYPSLPTSFTQMIKSQNSSFFGIHK